MNTKKFIVFIILILFNICRLSYGQNDNRWIKIENIFSNKLSAYFDKETIETNDKSLTVWIKFDGDEFTYYNGNKVKHYKENVIIDLQGESYKVARVIISNLDGTTKEDYNNRKSGLIFPESVYENVYKALVKNENMIDKIDRYKNVYSTNIILDREVNVYVDLGSSKKIKESEINLWVKYTYTPSILYDYEKNLKIHTLFKYYSIKQDRQYKLLGGYFIDTSNNVYEYYGIRYDIWMDIVKENLLVQFPDFYVRDYYYIIPNTVMDKIYLELF